jgi:hypothetical protein
MEYLLSLGPSGGALLSYRQESVNNYPLVTASFFG